MAGTEPLIEARNISKAFGPARVLKGVSLTCRAGEVVLVLGANGAGKSTLLRIFAGLLRSDGGEMRREPRKPAGFVSHHLFLYSRLTVRENLSLFGALAGVDSSSVEVALVFWELSELAGTLVGDLSRGNQARVGLARAFLAAPALRLLDEPSSNLDERGVELLKRAIKGGGSSEAVTILATHDLHRLADVGTRVVVMSRGEIVADTGFGAALAEVAQAMEIYRESNR